VSPKGPTSLYRPRADEPDFIVVRGAREHNLAIDELRIPKRSLVVFTGVSGSGKSSLAFDTLYAEGQRRYVESLSSYARQFLGQMEKPKYEQLRGLSPTIAIEQKSASSNPRSTVGTVTEIYDYLRVLYARAGEQRCHLCGGEVTARSAAEIVDELLTLPPKTRATLMARNFAGPSGTKRADFIVNLTNDGWFATPQMQQQLPNAKLVLFEDFGQGIAFSAPARCVNEMRSFLEGL